MKTESFIGIQLFELKTFFTDIFLNGWKSIINIMNKRYIIIRE